MQSSSFPFTSSNLGPYIFLGNLLPNAFSLRSSLSVRDQALYPHKTTSKIAVMNIFIFLENKMEDEKSAPNYGKDFMTSICS